MSPAGSLRPWNRLLAALLAVGAPCLAQAQSITGGVAVNLIGGTPLPCVDVALEDSTGAVVAETRTRDNGAFQFVTPDSGAYGLRFTLDGYEPLRTPPSTLSLETDNVREYRLVFTSEQRTKRSRGERRGDSPVRPDPRGWVGPRYPTHQYSAGRDGEVLVQLVVDSTGRAVISTIRTLRSTHQDFTKAVLDFLPQARYFPAHRGSRPVCALVQQPFVFQIDRRGLGVPAVPPR